MSKYDSILQNDNVQAFLKLCALWRFGQNPSVVFKQPAAILSFQKMDLLRDRRLGHIERLGSLSVVHEFAEF